MATTRKRCRKLFLRLLLLIGAVVLLFYSGETTAGKMLLHFDTPTVMAIYSSSNEAVLDPNTMPQLNFWMVWTKGPENWNWLFNGVVMALLANHPKATLRVLSTMLPADFFDCFAAAGYNVSTMSYNLTDLAEASPLSAKPLVASGKVASSKHRVAHESDIVRLLVLQKYGGTYVDTDMLFLRPLEPHIVARSGIGMETTLVASSPPKFHDVSARRMNNAIIHIARPHDPFIECMVSELWRRYQPTEWATIGPDMTGACYDRLASGRPAVVSDEEALVEERIYNDARNVKRAAAKLLNLPFFGRRRLLLDGKEEETEANGTEAEGAAPVPPPIPTPEDPLIVPQVYPRNYFYPLDWRFAWYANKRDQTMLRTMWEVEETDGTFAFHLYNSHSHDQLDNHRRGGGYKNTGGPQPGSFLAEVLARNPVPSTCLALEVNTGPVLSLVPKDGEEAF